MLRGSMIGGQHFVLIINLGGGSMIKSQHFVSIIDPLILSVLTVVPHSTMLPHYLRAKHGIAPSIVKRV